MQATRIDPSAVAFRHSSGGSVAATTTTAPAPATTTPLQQPQPATTTPQQQPQQQPQPQPHQQQQQQRRRLEQQQRRRRTFRPTSLIRHALDKHILSLLSTMALLSPPQRHSPTTAKTTSSKRSPFRAWTHTGPKFAGSTSFRASVRHPWSVCPPRARIHRPWTHTGPCPSQRPWTHMGPNHFQSSTVWDSVSP